MLKQVNLLYLGTTVLILLDGSYMSRFWTQLEAWCAMQKLTPGGVAAEVGDSRRFLIKCIYNAAESAEEHERALVNTWKGKSPAEAHKILSRPDVFVTNGRDKEIHLPKLEQLSTLVKDSFAALLTSSQ